MTALATPSADSSAPIGLLRDLSDLLITDPALERVADKVLAGERLDLADGMVLFETREVPDGGDVTLFEYGNIDDGETYGTELELGATWGGLRAEAGYAWLRAADRATGATLLGRPAHSARTSVAYALPFGLRANVTGVHTGRTATARDSTGALVRRDALTRFDVRVSQSLPRGFELSAGVDNVLDTTLAGYPGYLGRQIHVGLSWLGARREPTP